MGNKHVIKVHPLSQKLCVPLHSQECGLLPQRSHQPAEGILVLIGLALNVLISFQGLGIKQITFLRVYLHNKILGGLGTVCLLILEEFWLITPQFGPLFQSVP